MPSTQPPPPLPLLRKYWYPGHIYKSTHKLKTLIFNQQINHILELRDARCPISSILLLFEQMIWERNHVQDKNHIKYNAWGEKIIPGPVGKTVLYHKMDLIPKSEKNEWKRNLELVHQAYFPDTKIYYTSKKESDSLLRPLMEIIEQHIDSHAQVKERSHRYPTVYPDLKILIAGMPNTGKSSLLKHFLSMTSQEVSQRELKKKVKQVGVGKMPGFTQNVSNPFLILDSFQLRHEMDFITNGNPMKEYKRELLNRNIQLRVYLMDAPGILPPSLNHSDTSTEDLYRLVKLSLIHALPNDLHRSSNRRGIDVLYLCDYLLWHIQQNSPKLYKELKDIAKKSGSETTENLSGEEVAKTFGMLKHQAKISDNDQPNKQLDIDIEASAYRFIDEWRSGLLSSYMRSYQDVCLDPLVFDKEALENWFENRFYRGGKVKEIEEVKKKKHKK